MGRSVSAGGVALLVVLASAGVARATCPDSPEPEICNGVDDDCDEAIDEGGQTPAGVGGTADPLDGTRHIGDPCGTDVGNCSKGQLVCDLGGRVECQGTQDPEPEVCDCLDNDCDGEIDEIDADAGIPPCGPGTTCVSLTSSSPPTCLCASECDSTDRLCPSEAPWCLASSRQDGSGSSTFCWPYVHAVCEAICELDTVRSSTGEPDCSPNPEDGVAPCTCLDDWTCSRRCHLMSLPCFGGTMCAMATGKCEPLGSCWFTGCAAGLECRDGKCLPKETASDAAAPGVPNAGGAAGAGGGTGFMTHDAATVSGGASTDAASPVPREHSSSSTPGGCGCRVTQRTPDRNGAALFESLAALAVLRATRRRRDRSCRA